MKRSSAAMAATLLSGALAAAGCSGEGPATPIELSSAPGRAGGLAVDRNWVYWASAGSPLDGGTLLRVGREGGTPEVLAKDQAEPFEVALAGPNLYWMNRGLGLGDGALLRASKSGGGSVRVLERQTAAYDLKLGVLATGESVLAWTAPEDQDEAKRVKLLDLGSGQPNESFAGPQVAPDSVAVGATAIYWTDPGARTVSSYVLGMGQATVLAAGQDDPRGIAFEAPYVVWTTLGRADGTVRGSVARLDAAAGAEAAPKVLIADQNIGGRGRIAVSKRWVYWFNVEGATHTLMSIPIEGGVPRKVAVAQGTEVVDLAIWDNRIYWTVAGDFEGRVLAVDEP